MIANVSQKTREVEEEEEEVEKEARSLRATIRDSTRNLSQA